MDLTEKGWLQKYIEYREEINSPTFDKNENWEKFIYKTIQPTGIMYGHPLNLPKFIKLDLQDWPVKERIKLIFTEAIISTDIIMNSSKDNYDQLSNWFPKTIVDFYEALSAKSHSINPFYKSKTEAQMAEKILNKRVVVKAGWNSNFWQGFFQNILLFTDIIIMSNSLKEGDIKLAKNKIEFLREKALTIMAVAAYADGEIDSSERKLFDFFLGSSGLQIDKKNELKTLLNASPSMGDIKGFDKSSWLEKKYLLELAILTVWADRNLQEKEEDFLLALSQKMGFDNIELHASMTAIESFVMNNWEKVHYLKSKQNYLIISKRLTERMSKIALKYKHEISKEISESKELIHLINKSRNLPLTVEEKGEIRQQLIDILKSIPTFVIIALPFSFLTLPILFKILPKSVFPSSFDENKILKTNKKDFISE